MLPLVIDDRVTLPAKDLSFAAVRAAGPGGQNVNKVASKVELRFDVEGTTSLDPATKARLRVLARTKLDAEGYLLVTSQKTRDQRMNLEDAREKLAELVRRALVRPKTRRATRPGRGAVERRLKEKKHHSDKKQSRRDGD